MKLILNIPLTFHTPEQYFAPYVFDNVTKITESQADRTLTIEMLDSANRVVQQLLKLTNDAVGVQNAVYRGHMDIGSTRYEDVWLQQAEFLIDESMNVCKFFYSFKHDRTVTPSPASDPYITTYKVTS